MTYYRVRAVNRANGAVWPFAERYTTNGDANDAAREHYKTDGRFNYEVEFVDIDEPAVSDNREYYQAVASMALLPGVDVEVIIHRNSKQLPVVRFTNVPLAVVEEADAHINDNSGVPDPPAGAWSMSTKDEMFEELADTLGEADFSYNEFDPSDEAVTHIRRGTSVETVAEYLIAFRPFRNIFDGD